MDQTPLGILIADDDDPLRRGLRESLEARGFMCQEAGNGLRALSWIKKHHVDVLLTDPNMPHMDGLELTHILSQDLSYGSPFVVLMSGGFTDRLRKKAYEAGAQAVLDKPFTIEDFLVAIRHYHDHLPQAA